MPTSNDLFLAATNAESARAEQYQQAQADARNRYFAALGGGQGQLEAWTRGLVSGEMPQFHRALQGARESASRRGVANGELGTSYEGDVASAFQRNISNAIAGQAVNVWGQQTQGYGDAMRTDAQMAESSRNRYFDALAGNRDYETSERNYADQKAAEKKRRKGGIWGTVGTIAGAALGSVIPGVGTGLGATVGGAIGRGVGGGGY